MVSPAKGGTAFPEPSSWKTHPPLHLYTVHPKISIRKLLAIFIRRALYEKAYALYRIRAYAKLSTQGLPPPQCRRHH